MKYVEYLTFACFAVGALLASIDLSNIGLYLFAAGVALAVLRSIAAEMDQQQSPGQPPES